MSTQITTELIKELRDQTGISVMQCKRALEEAEGNMDKALAILKKTSSDIALKKQDRTAADGAVMIKNDAGSALLVALHCETDFVAHNEDFLNLLTSLVTIASTEGIEAMKTKSKDLIDPIIQKTGEKIELGDAYVVSGSTVGSYVHNGKLGVIVSLEGGNTELAKDIAMHVAAMKPEYIAPSDISPEATQTMTEIFEKEVAGIDKPEDIKKKMLEGKINTYFKEKTLLSQPFIKDGDKTIEALLGSNSAKILEVKRYVI